jgi:quinol monooxygenase YgiN
MELTIEIRAKPGKFQELYQTLQALLPTIRKEKGCRECRIYRDVEDGEVFFLSVHWEAQTSLEHYMRSTNGMALLGAIDMLSEKAWVKIGEEARREGIDVLKRMRKSKTPAWRKGAKGRSKKSQDFPPLPKGQRTQ